MNAHNNPSTLGTVLIIDDNQSFGDEMARYLQLSGYNAVAISSVADLEVRLVEIRPDLLIIDQWLGDTTGTEVLKRIRHLSTRPCIMVTGKSDPTDIIVNLELGADDHIDKSANAREILARIKAVMRRARPEVLGGEPAAASRPAAIGAEWKLCALRRELFRPDGTPCRLTSAEYETLRLLHDAAGQPISRARICEVVFHRAYQLSDRAPDTIVKKLRRKIQPDGESTVIKSVRPMGYVFAGFPDAP